MEAERLPAQVPRRRVLFENEDTDVPELTPAIVNGYIRKIIVYAPDKSGGHCRQKVGNCWNFLDENEIPEIEGTVVYQRPLKMQKTARSFGHTVHDGYIEQIVPCHYEPLAFGDFSLCADYLSALNSINEKIMIETPFDMNTCQI